MIFELRIFWAATAIIIVLASIFIINNKISKKTLFMLLVLLAISSYGLYWHFGSYKLLPEYYSANTKQALQQYAALRPMLQDLRKKSFRLKIQLEQQPNSVELWQDLAVTYMLLHKIAPGVAAFKTAYRLDPGNQQLAFSYIKALNMLAITAYQAQDYQLALETWNVLEQEIAKNNLLADTAVIKLKKLLTPLRNKAQQLSSNETSNGVK